MVKKNQVIKSIVSEIFDKIPFNGKVSRIPPLASLIEQLAKCNKTVYMSHFDISMFLIDCLNQELVSKYGPHCMRPKPTGTFKNDFSNEKQEIVSKITDYIISIPRKYRVSYYIPSLYLNQKSEILVNDDMVLEFAEHNLSAQPPSFSGKLLPSREVGQKEPKDNVRYYLKFTFLHQGYLNKYTSVSRYSAARPLSILKQVIYLAYCLKLITKEPGSVTSPLVDPLQHTSGNSEVRDGFYVDKVSNETGSWLLPADIKGFLKTLRISLPPEGKKLNNLFEELKIYSSRLYDTEEKENDERDKIKASLEWGFESIASLNETFSFIQKCIAIEALLGNNNKDGSSDENKSVTNMLKNRCAYLLASKHSERNDLLRRFNNLYKIRSKLVHGSKPFLNLEEEENLWFAEDTLNKIILKEISMIG